MSYRSRRSTIFLGLNEISFARCRGRWISKGDVDVRFRTRLERVGKFLGIYKLVFKDRLRELGNINIADVEGNLIFRVI